MTFAVCVEVEVWEKVRELGRYSPFGPKKVSTKKPVAVIPRAKTLLFHDTEVSTITCSTGLRFEHVEVMSFVVAVLETLGTQ